MNRKKIVAVLAVMAVAAVSFAGCQQDAPVSTSTPETVSSQTESRVRSNNAALYQDSKPIETLTADEEKFAELEKAISAAIEHADRSPQWVSSVVTEDWLKPYFDEGNVLLVSFADTRSFTVDGLPRTCDSLLLIQKENWIVFSEKGQYKNGPLVISGEDTIKILERV